MKARYLAPLLLLFAVVAGATDMANLGLVPVYRLGTPTPASGSTPAINSLGTPTPGNVRYCTNCQQTNPCAAGTPGVDGAIARAERVSATPVWNCGAPAAATATPTNTPGSTATPTVTPTPSNTPTPTNTPTPAPKQWTCAFILGADDGSALADTNDQAGICWNRLGTTVTISEVACQSDAGTPSINVQNDDGSAANILSSNLSCATGTGATSSTFSGSEASLANGSRVNFLMVTAGGTAKRVTVVLSGTY